MHTETMEVGTPIGLSLDQETRGMIDVQIATAKRYPRSIKAFIDEVRTIATLDEDTAAECFYNKPQGGEMVTGPSARMAEIVASCWGHMRVEGRPVSDDGRFVTSRGTAWDLQNNVLIAFETKRRVTNRQGVRYSDDMVMTTTNAATSIAIRNAVFRCVPKAFWSPIVDECREVARGKAETIVSTRSKMLKHFATLGVDRVRVFAALGVAGIEDVTLAHVEHLRGLATAIKDGDTTIDEAFPIETPAAPKPPTDIGKSTLDRLVDTMPAAPKSGEWTPASALAAEVTREAARKQQQEAHEVPRARRSAPPREREPGEEG